MSDVKRRVDQDPSSNSAARQSPEHEYDGSTAPVLIRLPDLTNRESASVPAAANSLPSASPPPAASGEGTSNGSPSGRSRRNTRLIDRSHLPQRPKIPASEGTPFNFRSKTFVGILLLVIIGLAYIFGGSGSEPQEPEADTWAATTEQPAGPPQGATDLWPAGSSLDSPQVTSQQPNAARANQASPPPPSSIDSIPNRQNAPTLSGPGQQWTKPEQDTFPVSNPTGGWPDANTSTPESPMQQVSFPEQGDGASTRQVDTQNLAAMVGMQLEPTIEPQLLALSGTQQIPPQRRNHERLRTSLR